MQANIQVFQRVLDPRDNQTGGGAASAIAAAMGASLVAMVARLSIGRKDMPYADGRYQELDTESQALSQALFDGARADSQAFDEVMEAYRLPKAAEPEKDARSSAIQAAMIRATRVPLENAGLALQALDFCRLLQGRSNPNAASDLECAWLLARAGLLGFLSNAHINLASLRQDTEETQNLLSRFQALSDQARGLGDWA
jgi:formiminotetrahydrofolate cyclodeaminase